MGYYLKAILGPADILKKESGNFRRAKTVILTGNLAIIPLSQGLIQEFAGDPDFSGADELPLHLVDWILGVSAIAPIGFIEAEYFGGDGAQSAKIWTNGRPVLDLRSEENSINHALAYFGVITTPGMHDEFATAGLDRHRNTEDWTRTQK